MSEQTREPKFWACRDDEEQLAYTDIAEAVEKWADDCFPDPLPDTVTVYGFAEIELPTADHIASRVLDDVREWLDEEYGNQIDGDPTEIPAALKDAARVFAEAVRAHYPVWSCEQVAKQEVNVADYVDLADYAKCVAEDAARHAPKPESADAVR